MTKQQFLEKPTNSNVEFVAQRFLTEYNRLGGLRKTFKKLDEVLFKSWSKDMTFNELKEALELANQHCGTTRAKKVKVTPVTGSKFPIWTDEQEMY